MPGVKCPMRMSKNKKFLHNNGIKINLNIYQFFSLSKHHPLGSLFCSLSDQNWQTFLQILNGLNNLKCFKILKFNLSLAAKKELYKLLSGNLNL